jgi:hypothetical protein
VNLVDLERSGQKVSVVLDLDAGTNQISGTLTRVATGDTRAFRGTLELLAVLEEVLTDASRAPSSDGLTASPWVPASAPMSGGSREPS